MKNIFFLLATICLTFTAKSQTSTILLKNATPQVSSVIAGGNSVIIGDGAGNDVQNTAANNVFVGFISGMSNSSGTDNTFIGWGTGSANQNGVYNTFIGRSAGGSNLSGNSNTYIGWGSGLNATGSSNVFLGRESGRYELGSDKLYIANSATSTPLIWGDFQNELVKLNSKVGIGFDSSTLFPVNAGGIVVSSYKLFVAGGILAEEIRINSRVGNQWADYVFNENYSLKPLSEVEEFIKKNGHLPNVPSAEEIAEDGFEISSIIKIQQEKIEELTLYLIEQNKLILELRKELDKLKEE